MNKKHLPTLLLLLVLSVSATAYADDDYNKFDYPFRVFVGGFWPEVDSKLAINSEDRDLGAAIDIEKFLGVEGSKGVAWGGVAWNFARRHSVELEYFSLERSGSESDTFSPPIEVGDFYIENGSIDTFYNTSVGRLTYGFSMIRNDRTDLQFKAGLHLADLEAGVRLAGQICGPTTIPTEPPGCPGAQSETAASDVTAPLPHIGASLTYVMTPNWVLNVQAMGFAVEIDSIEGTITEFTTDIAWQPFEHFGFGAGFRYFKTSVEGREPSFNGKFDFEYLGPTLYVHAVF